MVKTLKEEDQDFEWYPTTDEIIQVIKTDAILELDEAFSILDCGAGDGRVLNALTEHGDKYAIEKADPLLQVLSKNIFIVGTDFNEQTLIDKKVDVVFSNPPYSVFEAWATKIITEANSSYIYLVIPERWKNCEPLQAALKKREAKTKVIGSFDFLKADRAARAKVDILKIELTRNAGWNRSHPKVDPFDLWFEENFKIGADKEESTEYEKTSTAKKTLKEEIQHEMTKGSDLVATLYGFYQRDLQKLINTYQSLEAVDSAILLELDVNIEGVKKALKLRISGLKDCYWNELFNNFYKVTDRLTEASRKKLLGTLTSHTHVDFTISNAHAIIIWVIKNANEYFDTQFIDVIENLVEKSNIKLYKSNKKTFGDEQWRYCRKPEDLDKYSLDYRIVTTHSGGLNTYEYSRNINGLSERAASFLDDICAIAANIGFDTAHMERSNSFEWDTRIKNNFKYRDIHTGEHFTLFEATAFKNGNLHIKFNQSFMCRINVEFGRLKGWVKSHKEAADELNISIEEAAQGFGKNLQLEINSNLMIEHKG